MSSMLAEVLFDYQHGSVNSKNVLTRDQLEQLQAVCSRPVKYEQLSQHHMNKNSISFWNDEDKQHEDCSVLLDMYYIGGHSNIAALDQLLSIDNIEFKILTKIKEVPEYKVEESILHKLIKLESKLDMFDKIAEFNFKVGVHISDLGLLNVRHVTWIEDACTEHLQDMLDDGWRILAVCPQPDSRRPDYILGRNDKHE